VPKPTTPSLKSPTWLTRAPIAVAAAIALVGLVLPLPRATADHTTATADRTAATEQFARGEAALRATIDPETGGLKISSAPLTLDGATAESMRRDDEGLKEVRHANGAVSIHLQGRFHHASVAQIGDDGKVYVCTDDVKDVDHALDGPVASQKAEVK